MNKKKVYIYGSDGVGWSIDADYQHTKNFLSKNLNITLSSNLFRADIYYFIWWNQAVRYAPLLHRLGKKIIVCVTNDIKANIKTFESLKNYVNVWVCANQSQLMFLNNNKLCAVLHPYYINENTFIPIKLSKEEICHRLAIDFDSVRHKYLICSIQRDSLGSNLNEPKWQKDPEFLFNCIKLLPETDFLLILAGPRRHWIIQRLMENKIPHIFVGKYPKKNVDDILTNNLSSEIVNLIYNLSDIVIINSKSEGGPKSIPESMLAQTLVVSTDTGFSKLYLPDEMIIHNPDEAVKLIQKLQKDCEYSQEMRERNFNVAYSINNFATALDRMNQIIELVLQ